MLTSYTILFNILLSRLRPYIDEIIADHRCGFRRNRPTIDQVFCIHQTLEKNWEYNDTVHRLFIDFKKAYNSLRREVLCNILVKFGISIKLVRLTKMCLNETYSKVRIGKHLSESFRIQNGLRQGDALSSLLFNFGLQYAIGNIQENQVGLKLNVAHQLLAYADDVNLLGDNIDTIIRTQKTLIDGRKELGLEINIEKDKYIWHYLVTRKQNRYENSE
jgi:hypothetical protein